MTSMRLSSIPGVPALAVRDDGEFATLGFLSTPRPNMLTFVESRRFLGRLRFAPRPLAVITTPALAGALEGVRGIALAEDPRRVFFEVHNYLATQTAFYGTAEPTALDPTAAIHPSADIPATGVRIGPRTLIGPRVVVRGRCRIGADVVVHAGAVLGAEGFQASAFPDRVLDMVHAGGLDIADNVVIYANAVVARAVFDEETVLGKGTRVGNLAFVSHNVRIGKGCFIGHGAVVNGNVVIGDGAWVGPGSTIADCLRIGVGARVSLGSAVISNVGDGMHVTGNVAIEHRRYLRHLARVTAGGTPRVEP
jgi:UDP-3-O-[3-hydroxymyristoyl] glucosamine N-acyltransferase